MRHSLLGLFFVMKDILVYEEGSVWTNSLMVSDKFNKSHSNVVRAIDDIIGKSYCIDNECNAKLIRHMFCLYYDIIDMPNGGSKQAKRYRMNRDGFSLLVMGFTGLDAISFKIDFINQFNKMEKEIKDRNSCSTVSIPDFSNPAEAARAWANQYEAAQIAIVEKAQVEEERKQAVKTIELQQPDVEFAQSFKKPGENDMLIREVAKKLEQNNIIVAEKNLRLYLERTKFMFRNSRGEWELHSNVVRKGYGVYRSFYVDRHTGKIINGQTIYMTGSGYDVTIKAIKGTMRHIFEEYGKMLD